MIFQMHHDPYPPPRLAVLLGRWLGASFAWGVVVVPTLFLGAIVAGIFSFPGIAYLFLLALVLGIAWVCTGCGIFLWLLAFAVFRVEWRNQRVVSACLRGCLWTAAGIFLAWCGIGTIWGFFLYWPLGYWPQAKVPPP